MDARLRGFSDRDDPALLAKDLAVVRESPGGFGCEHSLEAPHVQRFVHWVSSGFSVGHGVQLDGAEPKPPGLDCCPCWVLAAEELLECAVHRPVVGEVYEVYRHLYNRSPIESAGSQH